MSKKFVGLQELSERYAKEYGGTVVEAVKILKNVFKLEKEVIIETDGVQIRDFGTLEKVSRKERVGRDIRTKKEIIIPAHLSIKFKVSKGFKGKLNE